ncbi:T9SS type A sorting domain-containing protein [candidate division KSB1 bacterium]|nr:T9SS type A sorting domain-containing protein [candidate division KSB1 bacterium]
MKNLLLFALAVLVAAGTTFALDIVIDAQKDDFYNTLTGPDDGWIHIPHTANNDNGNWGIHDDENDLSANFWCAWDETYFYWFEEVWDEYVTCINGTTYNNDCLELKFDPDPTKGAPASGSGIFAINISALDTFDTDGPVTGIDNMYPGGNSALTGHGVYTRGVDYEKTLTALGYNIEGRLPWEHIYFTSDSRGPVLAQVGEIFGMAIMNHENDGSGSAPTREGSIQWASHMRDAVWNDTSLLGKVTFLEGNKLKMSTENYITGMDTNLVDYQPVAQAVETQPLLPLQYELAQNYPNPFNPMTTIEFSLPTQALVTLKVYDILGNEVAELVNGIVTAGTHAVAFDGADLSSGIYFYKLNNGHQILTNKMMLVK